MDRKYFTINIIYLIVCSYVVIFKVVISQDTDLVENNFYFTYVRSDNVKVYRSSRSRVNKLEIIFKPKMI